MTSESLLVYLLCCASIDCMRRSDAIMDIMGSRGWVTCNQLAIIVFFATREKWNDAISTKTIWLYAIARMETSEISQLLILP
jgi:hypothetical protein